jgi:hypothetical protein
MHHAALALTPLLVACLASPAWAGQAGAPCPYGYDRPGAAPPPGVQRPWGSAGGRAEGLEGSERWFALSATVAQARQPFTLGFKHQACGATFQAQVGAQGHFQAQLASKVWPAKYWVGYQGQKIGELWVEGNGQVRFRGQEGFNLVGPRVAFR